jgi:hypothetical protein
MTASDRVRVPLFDVLEAHGWYWEGDHLYAPRGSFAVLRNQESELPLWQLTRVHERMSQKLEALRQSRPAHLSVEHYDAFLSDLEALVSISRELIAGAGAQS